MYTIRYSHADKFYNKSLGIGCGAVDRAVASLTGDPWSSANFIYCIKIVLKHKNKEKRVPKWPKFFLKKV